MRRDGCLKRFPKGFVVRLVDKVLEVYVRWCIHEQVTWDLHGVLRFHGFKKQSALITSEDLSQPTQAAHTNVFDDIKTGGCRSCLCAYVVAGYPREHLAIAAIELAHYYFLRQNPRFATVCQKGHHGGGVETDFIMRIVPLGSVLAIRTNINDVPSF